MGGPKMDPMVKALKAFRELTPEQKVSMLALVKDEARAVSTRTAKLRQAPKNAAKPLGGEPVPAKVS